jgi:hypothetical protein
MVMIKVCSDNFYIIFLLINKFLAASYHYLFVFLQIKFNLLHNNGEEQ